jgi:hypothetical protein
MVIGLALLALDLLLGFAVGYVVRSAKSHRRRREAAALDAIQRQLVRAEAVRQGSSPSRPVVKQRVIAG